jgi:hypothetical protein
MDREQSHSMKPNSSSRFQGAHVPQLCVVTATSSPETNGNQISEDLGVLTV